MVARMRAAAKRFAGVVAIHTVDGAQSAEWRAVPTGGTM